MNEAVYSALVTQLLGVEDLPPLVRENEARTARGTFCTAVLLRPKPSSLTVQRDEQYPALVVDLFVPVNTGTSAVNALADNIISAFPRGLVIATTEHFVHVLRAYRETAARFNDQLHQVTVIVETRLVI